MLDLKKFKAWSPLSGEPTNIEQKSRLARILAPWRSTLVIGVFFGIAFAGCYAVIIRPMSHTEDWQSVQKENRKGLEQEKIQPGGMRVWSDPFNRKR